jgi:hypothetical protein
MEERNARERNDMPAKEPTARPLRPEGSSHRTAEKRPRVWAGTRQPGVDEILVKFNKTRKTRKKLTRQTQWSKGTPHAVGFSDLLRGFFT